MTTKQRLAKLGLKTNIITILGDLAGYANGNPDN